jgi:hypothetical protein
MKTTYTRDELESILANRWDSTFCEVGKPGVPNQFAKNMVAFFGSHPRANSPNHEKRISDLEAAISFWKMARYPENIPETSDMEGRCQVQAAIDLAESTLCEIVSPLLPPHRGSAE